MNVFIPIKAFKSYYSSFSDLLTPDGINQFQQKLEQDADEVFRELGVSELEKKEFIHSLSHPKTILFQSWVEQNSILFQCLTKQGIHLYSDPLKHLNHQYSEEYKNYLSPFLAEILLTFAGVQQVSEREKALSFCVLLDKKHNAVVEAQLFSPILADVKENALSCKTLKEEKELIACVNPLCDEQAIHCVNYLSRASYALKMEYVDAVLSVLKYKSCTPRYANWVLKELKKVRLNSEHEYKITDLIRDLKKGDLEVRNHGNQKRMVKGSTVLTVLLVGLLSMSVFWMVKYKPFSDIEQTNFSNDTSFMQFSIEERKKIDSLLLVMNGNIKDDHLQIDQGNTLMGESDVLTVRKELNNPVFEKIHNDFILDAENRSSFTDSCDNSIPFEEINHTEPLSSKLGSTKAMLKNESEYDVLLILANDSKKGSVYSTMIKTGETISFEMDNEDILFLVAGNEYNKYLKSSNIENSPSSDFKHHFCDIDDNYLASISTVYQMNNHGMQKVKLLLMGDKGAYFSLIDLHSILEEI